MKVRKKPIVVEAYPLVDEYVDQIKRWADDAITIKSISYLDHHLKMPRVRLEAIVKTLGGTMHAIEGDWIIKGVNGEFYACEDDIFRKSYDIIDSNESNVISWC